MIQLLICYSSFFSFFLSESTPKSQLARKINNLFHRQKISLIRKKKNNERKRKPQQGKAKKKKNQTKSTIPIRKNNTEDTNEYNFLTYSANCSVAIFTCR